MSSSELFAKAAEINNKMNQWVRQKDLIGQRSLYYQTLRLAYQEQGDEFQVALCTYILRHHNMRRRVETWELDFYKQEVQKSYAKKL